MFRDIMLIFILMASCNDSSNIPDWQMEEIKEHKCSNVGDTNGN